MIDEKELLRVRGRLPNSFPRGVRQPIILPANHRVTELYVRYLHGKYHHGHDTTVLNEIRVQHYIPGLRTLLRQVTSSCQVCRVRRPNISEPQMGLLPDARVAVEVKPFTYCGVDYFGPLEVVVGRRREKRWVALFTCLTTRAVDLQLAYQLDAHSCVMCVRKMMAKHDVEPVEMWSDNGTNFRAVAKLWTTLPDQFPAIKWRFNPPGAPHMGGAWERLVRSVKRCMSAILGDTSLSDEVLLCVLAEAEWIVNN